MKRRDWSRARAKVEAEGRCRSCGRGESAYRLEAAHIVPRSRVGIGGEDPRNIVPLCPLCHGAQHRGELELLPLLDLSEQSYIVSLVGIEEARRRTTRETVA